MSVWEEGTFSSSDGVDEKCLGQICRQEVREESRSNV
jgi:hypothetical protein